MGLVSPGGVHSHQDHAAALAQAACQGRRADPRPCLHRWPRHPAAFGGRGPRAPRARRCRRRSRIATVCGRYYAMDRDHRWERVAKAYDAIVAAEGPRFPDAGAVIADAYAHDVSDEFVLPAVVGDYRGMQRRRRRALLQFPRRPRARDPCRPARPGLLRLPRASVGPLRRRSRHDRIQRRAQCVPARRSFRRKPCRMSWARWWPMPAARSCAWPRPRNIRTSPTSSTAARRRPTRARTASWSPPPRLRPTTCSRRCRRRS